MQPSRGAVRAARQACSASARLRAMSRATSGLASTSSTAALEAFRATPERFDAVLSDESMPDMTGSELARAIREIRGDIPIVLMSGYVTAALTHRARDAGVLDVLAKPLVARDIARSLADALHA